MSGFASKLSAAGTKGWKDFQSLWSEPKTTLNSADTSPGEKSSLLGRSSYGSGDESSKSNLVGESDESWGEWNQESGLSSSAKGSSSNKTIKSDWSAGNEDDLEAWLNDDTSALSLDDKAKSKKNSNNRDSWKGNSSSKTTSSAKSSSSSKSKKKSHKSLLSASEGWQDWNMAAKSKQKEPLVGNLLDLEVGTGISTSATGDGWDNEVLASDDDDDDGLHNLSANKTR